MLKHIRKLPTNYVMMIVVGTLLAGLLGFTIYRLMFHMREAVNYTIVDDVAALEKIFLQIDAECEITSIAHDRNYIDFLQVATFAGSQVGPLNLRKPEQWKGPYRNQNPEVHTVLYELVRVKEGYALVPGRGVKLMNGKVIGTDVIIDATTDLDALINEQVGLEWNGKPLARLLALKHIRAIPTSDERADNEI